MRESIIGAQILATFISISGKSVFSEPAPTHVWKRRHFHSNYFYYAVNFTSFTRMNWHYLQNEFRMFRTQFHRSLFLEISVQIARSMSWVEWVFTADNWANYNEYDLQNGNIIWIEKVALVGLGLEFEEMCLPTTRLSHNCYPKCVCVLHTYGICEGWSSYKLCR